MNGTTVARRCVPIAVVALAIVPGTVTPASAQAFISPLIGYNFGGDSGCPEISGCENKNLNLGVAFGSLGAIVGAEFEFGYAKDFFGETEGVSSNVLTVMGSFMVAPRFGPIQPYVLGGLGLIKTNVELTVEEVLDSDNNNFGWNFGGGLFVFFGEHVGIRGDIRYFHAFQDLEVLSIPLGGLKLDFGRASGAVVFRF